VHASSITAVQSNGVHVPTTLNGLGEAVLIGAQPLSQSCMASNGQHNIVVFGTVGTNYQVQSRIGFTGTWTNEANPAAIMPTNLWLTFSNVPSASGKFFRSHAL
jgi:hypothetical protein